LRRFLTESLNAGAINAMKMRLHPAAVNIIAPGGLRHQLQRLQLSAHIRQPSVQRKPAGYRQKTGAD